MEKDVKIAWRNVVQAIKVAGISIGKFLWSVLLLIWTIFNWLAYERIKIPRLSFLIELLALIIPTILIFTYYRAKAVIAEDELGKRLYEMDTVYKDSLLKTEVDGWKQGRMGVLDSLRILKEENLRLRRLRIRTRNAERVDSAAINEKSPN